MTLAQSCRGCGYIFWLIMMVGCASVERFHYPESSDPQVEIQKLDREIQQALADQKDVLVPAEFASANQYFERARFDLNQKNDLKNFWEDLGAAKAYLNKTVGAALEREEKVKEVLKSRRKALEIGARHYNESREMLFKVDESFRRKAPDLSQESFDDDFWSRMKSEYDDLYVSTVQETELGAVRQTIDMAKKRGARRYAPLTLTETEGVLAKAEEAIAHTPENSESYLPMVARADKVANQLLLVTNTARRAALQSNEDLAKEIVSNGQVLGDLKGEIIRRRLNDRPDVGPRSDNEWQRTLKDVQSEFSRNEAEIYRAGDKILIRLKKNMHGSTPVLNKVTNVIEGLNAQDVEIKGEKASASEVAQFIREGIDNIEVKEVGYGYSEPSAKVDVVIKPKRTSSDTSQSSISAIQNPTRRLDEIR